MHQQPSLSEYMGVVGDLYEYVYNDYPGSEASTAEERFDNFKANLLPIYCKFAKRLFGLKTHVPTDRRKKVSGVQQEMVSAGIRFLADIYFGYRN